TILPPPPAAAGAPTDQVRPPGERYFRHPGDVVRLVIWGLAALLLGVFLRLAPDTSDGLTSDLGRAASRVPTAVRELALALAQVGAIVVPVVVVVLLVLQQRWRRLLVGAFAGIVGALVLVIADRVVHLSGRTAGGVTSGTWVASTSFPSLAYVSGAAAATAVGKVWLSRPWRRAADIAILVLLAVMALAGSSGVPDLLFATALGIAVGAAVLVVVGAPNRRPTPAMVAEGLAAAGLEVRELTLQRAEGGRAQLYVADAAAGPPVFVKVYAGDTRDADLLYRGYRALVLRGPSEEWSSRSLTADVENEALLLLARRDDVRCPELRAVVTLSDSSPALALDRVLGTSLDAVPVEDFDDNLLDAVWREVGVLHDAHLAHRSLRMANLVVDGAGQPTITGLGSGVVSATPRQISIDRAELLTSLATTVGPERAVASAARFIPPDQLALVVPFLQPLALSSATRKQASKSLLHQLRSEIATTTGTEPPPLEQLVRVRPRTLLMIAALALAFYVLLPQLANVGDSVQAMRSANWGWLAVAVVFSLLTYVASAVGMAGGVPDPLPPVANVQAQLASSFVNRVTPANVGGMALNVRFMQKAGVEPAKAVTGVGLNTAAGAIVHLILLFVFLAWAGQGGGGFKLPASSKLLVVIAVVLAIIGIVLATKKGRRLFRVHVIRWLRQSVSSMATLARSPAKLAELFGGSVGVTVAYIGALYAAVLAFDHSISFAQVGAVYLGASIIAAAAPTPGGLGAMEAALVAGLTGVGVDSGIAVAAVLSYRLVTYWLPILPGWLSFHSLERHNLI
ncbi:MAG TPA: lysylphosphatidylglycerol synthase transmembrane domain-containing protein, partial [Acidimicrobiales bacterium]